MDKKIIQNNANKMRQLALMMGKNNKLGAHYGAAMSAMEIFSCLYGGIMDIEKNASFEERDALIVGKGHCVLAYYSALAVYGYLDEKLLEVFDKDGSPLQGHPMMNEEQKIDFSGGSLGMALSQGVGVALSRKMKHNSQHVFVILGDGECQEGAVWEAAMSASHFNLNNLTVIVDRNHLQYDGDTEEVMSLQNFVKKWESFGFTVYETNGNDVETLYPVLEKAKQESTPACVIANTVKGKGVSFMEGNKKWHNSRMTEEEFEQACKELEDGYGM